MIGARHRPDWVRVPDDLDRPGARWSGSFPCELAPDPKGNPRGELVLWTPPWAVELFRFVVARAIRGVAFDVWERVIGLALVEPDMAVACALVEDAIVAYSVGGHDAVWRWVEEVHTVRRARGVDRAGLRS